jgi:hypothetical protein
MKYSFVLAFAFSVSLANAQPPATPAEAKPFIPEGYEVLDYQTGDLNGDKKTDAILVLKISGEDSITEETPNRPMLLLIRQANGKLKKALQNDRAIMCRQCGGSFGDPYEAVSIKNNSLTLTFYGGSSWRWAYRYDFVYRPATKNWYLIKETQTNFHAGDPEATTKTAEISEAEAGIMPLEKFDYEAGYEESSWKVKAAKTFFYDSPKLGTKPRKAYLLKGNMAGGVRQLKNFIEISYDDGKGNFTSGYILRKDLEAVK